MPKEPTWKEEFDKKFIKNQKDSGQFINDEPVEWTYIDGLPSEIKSFISKTLQEELEKKIKEIWGLPVPELGQDNGCWKDALIGYKTVILSILRKNNE